MAAVDDVVIGSRYCNADATTIGVLTPVLQDDGYKLVVTDNNGNIIFRVKGTSTTFHKQRVLVDSNGTPIVTFCMKCVSMHKRWQAFRGNSVQKKDLIFSAKESTMMPMLDDDVDIHVYLAHNREYDYTVSSSSAFYKGNSIIPEACRDHIVKVSPNVDVAFIVSLIVIKDGMRAQEVDNHTIQATLLRVASSGYLS